MFDAVAIGELLIDFATVSTDNDGYPMMAAHPGGAPANFLAAINKFGGKTALIGKVGNDTFGNLLLGTLRDSGIDTSGMLVDDSVFTTLAFVTFDATGDRKFAFARKPGADTQLSFDEIRTDLIDSAKLLHFGTLSLTQEPSRSALVQAVAYAKAHGKLVSCDPNLRKPLWNSLDEAKEQMNWALHQADIVKISDDEVDFLFGLTPEKAAEKLLMEYGVKLAFITCGAEGCLFANAKGSGKVPALKNVKVKDTTGAGDIFGGSVMYKVLQTGKAPEELEPAELTEIVRFACTAAGLSTEKSGGICSIPELADVEEAMRR